MVAVSGGNPPRNPGTQPTPVGGVPTPGPGGLGTGAIKQSGGSPARLPLNGPVAASTTPPVAVGNPPSGLGPGRPPSAPSGAGGDQAARGSGPATHGIADHGGAGLHMVHPTPADTTSTTHGNHFGTNAHTLASVAQATGVASGHHRAEA